MKLFRYIALGLTAYCASNSALFAITAIDPQPTAPTLYEFQYDPSSPISGFTPTFVEILVPTGGLGFSLAAASAIVDFQITTPEGVWTPKGYAPAVGNNTGTPFITGNLEVTSTGQLLFLNSVTIEGNVLAAVPANAIGLVDEVILTTTSVSDTITLSPADATGSIGVWDAVSVPETGNTCWLLLASVSGLCACRRVQQYRTEKVLAYVRAR